MQDLKQLIREVPGFPKPGILFYDITTLIKSPAGFRSVIDGLRQHYRDAKVDIVLGIEARGFIFAPALARLPLTNCPQTIPTWPYSLYHLWR